MKTTCRVCVAIFTLMLFGFSSFIYADDIEIYDENGNYSYGEIDRSGNIEIYDQDGNYSYGESDLI